MGPRIGECPPAGLARRQPILIAQDRHTVLIHLQPRRRPCHGTHFARRSAFEIPRGHRGSIPQIIKQRATAFSLFVEPALCLLFGRRFHLNFVGPMIQRPAISTVGVHLSNRAHQPLAYGQFKSIDMTCTPDARPVDSQRAATRTGRRHHPVSFSQSRRKRLLHHQMRPTRRHPRHPVRMRRRTGTQ